MAVFRQRQSKSGAGTGLCTPGQHRVLASRRPLSASVHKVDGTGYRAPPPVELSGKTESQMVRFDRFQYAGLGLALSLAWMSLPVGTAAAQDAFRIGHNRAWSNPALLIGLHKGSFEAAGVKVTATEFSNPADMITAIAGGSIDAATTPSTTFATAAQRGVRIKAVALIQGNNNPPIAYTVLTDSGINSAADLRGKKAGVNNYGGSHDLNLRAWLDKRNVSVKDVEILTIPVPSMPAALINKQVDIIPLAAADQGRVRLSYPGRTRTLFDYGDVYRDEVGSDENNSMLLVVSQRFIEASRETLVKFLRGYLRTVRTMNADPKVGLKDWSEAVGNKSLLELSAPPTIPNDGKIYMKALQFEADIALKYGYLKSHLDITRMVDHSMIEDAARSLN